MHIGTGNGSLPETFAAGLAEYVGITISLPEIELFETKFAGAENATVILLNKYDPRMYPKIRGNFDIIVDTHLKSYACCERHFEQMMQFFAAKLRRGGTLITTEKGVLWAWRGNTQRAYTPGAQIDPAIAQYRILGCDGLQRLGQRLGLTMSSVKVPNPQVASEFEDRVLILTKQ